MSPCRSRAFVPLAIAALSLLASCTDDVGPALTTPSVDHPPALTAQPTTVLDALPPPLTSPSTSPSTPALDTAAPADAPAAAAAMCARSGVETAGTVDDPALDEVSGLVASRTHAGVLWAHNDGSQGVLFALSVDGTVIGTHPLRLDDADGADDIEDIGLVGGSHGDDLLLADIGDNGADRDTVRLYRVPEPDPAAPGPVTDVQVLTFRYPDRPHNAETILVDEAAGTIVIVTKEQARDADGGIDQLGATLPSFVFEGPLDGHDDRPVELTRIGTIDTTTLEARTAALVPHPVSVLGFGGVVTGGDVSPDGSLVVLRTYAAVWIWPRGDDRSVAESVSVVDDAVPCEVASAAERQGEAIAFTGDRLVTISEGRDPAVHLLAG